MAHKNQATTSAHSYKVFCFILDLTELVLAVIACTTFKAPSPPTGNNKTDNIILMLEQKFKQIKNEYSVCTRLKSQVSNFLWRVRALRSAFQFNASLPFFEQIFKRRKALEEQVLSVLTKRHTKRN